MEKQEALDKLNELLKEGDNLPEYKLDNNPVYHKWHRKIKRIIEKIFGSTYLSDLEKTKFEPSPLAQGFDDVYNSNGELSRFNKSIIDKKMLIESFIEEVEEWEEHSARDVNTTYSDNVTLNIINIQKDIPKTKVFIVHGHDELAISQVSDIVRKLNLEPIVLRDQVSRSNTVIEKIEAHTEDIGFAVVLYTECDWGGKEKDDLQRRARQNVVLEHGYLMAKIGRENTFPLVKGRVETPGDISGVLYEKMDEHGAWRYKLADELKAAGYKISKDLI
ncbi:MAG: DNA-binding protein [Arcobacter sp.]|nr:MAG: DNA-binding protein [Arcobacter sp.]